MLNQIVEALQKRSDLAGWSVRQTRTRGAQVYAVPQGIEARRLVEGERYLVNVLRNTTTADGAPAIGDGNASLLPGGNIEQAIDQAALMAGLVANPMYGIPEPAPLPDVPLADTTILRDASSAIRDVMERMQAAVASEPGVRLTAGECFGEIHATHLVNSRGIDAEQESTQVDIELVLHGQKGERESEIFDELTRRRISDLNLESVVEERVQMTRDVLDAQAPASWQGPVVLRNEALTVFLAGDHLNESVIHTLASAAAKYSRLSSWEVGKPVFRTEVLGDPLTVWANRTLPFGIASNRFDAEGLPAQRVQLIRENELGAFTSSQRYADYLQIPATGDFGNIEIPAGTRPAAELLAEPYLEVVQFSWFNPNPITGDFATEIRFGYVVRDGKRTPFKGGQLIGNYMDALANVHWSAEMGFFGAYLGPQAARFNDLKVSGE